VKTNFGYGVKSYFYVILKYKGLSITPFSEWIKYGSNSFSEIVRYSEKYDLHDECWYSAFKYVQEACNLSINDEHEFIDRYIVGQCELMVAGLENILTDTKFNYYLEPIKPNKESLSYEPQGHSLIEFRGEKISGALNFIDKIRSFGGIVLSENYIKKIEIINKKIYPVLQNENTLLISEIRTNEELSKINHSQKNTLAPDYSKYNKIKYEFVNKDLTGLPTEKQQELRKENEEKFKELYPFEQNLIDKYDNIIRDINDISRILHSLNTTMNNIISYCNAIEVYFSQPK
jgi:hypothetical protein